MDEFKSRVDRVIALAKVGLEDFDKALKQERRRYWLSMLDHYEQAVEEEEDKYRRAKARVSLGLTVAAGITRHIKKTERLSSMLSELDEKTDVSQVLAVAVSPAEGLGMLNGFELMIVPQGQWEKVDTGGRVLLTLGEFKDRIRDLNNNILNAKKPFPLPIEGRPLLAVLKKDQMAQADGSRI